MCTFPIDEVVDLGLVDLPGLGELVPRAEEHHLRGLINDVDFVLVVKRPTDTNALWSLACPELVAATYRAAQWAEDVAGRIGPVRPKTGRSGRRDGP